MSFAPKKVSKPPVKKPDSKKLPPKAPEELLEQRISMLEQVVSNIQAQKNHFQPLKNLETKVDELKALDQDSKIYSQSFLETEKKINLQKEQVESLISQTFELPKTVTSENSFEELLSSVSFLEDSLSAFSKTKKTTTQKEALSLKEEMVTKLQSIEKELLSENLQEEAKVLSQSVQQAKELNTQTNQINSKSQACTKGLEETLETLALSSKSDQNWLYQELMQTVEESMEELETSFNSKTRDLHLDFKLELFALRTELSLANSGLESQSLESNLPSDSLGKAPILEKSSKSIIERVKNISDHNLRIAFDLVKNFEFSFEEISKKAKTLKTNGNQVNVESLESSIQTTLNKVNSTREVLESLGENTNLDIEKLEVNNSIMKDLSRKGIHTQTLEQETEEIKTQFNRAYERCFDQLQEVFNKVLGVWKSVSEVVTLQINLDNPEDLQAFDNAQPFIQ